MQSAQTKAEYMKYNQIYKELKVQLENMTRSGNYPDGIEYCDIPEWTVKE